MYLRTTRDQKLAQTAHPIGRQKTGEAVVIDPRRDVDRSIDAAGRAGTQSVCCANHALASPWWFMLESERSAKTGEPVSTPGVRSGNMYRLFVLFCLCGFAGRLAGQTVYPYSPDWVSADTPYSTGGALVDMNSDGWLDFVVANGNDMRRERLVIYYNDGTGSLPVWPDYQSADTNYNGHLAVADVNGDGWPDVAVGTTLGDGGPTVRLYLNNNGTLPATPSWTSAERVGAFHVAFGDVNGDGRPDLAVGTGNPYNFQHDWQNYVHMNINGSLEQTPSWSSDDIWDTDDVFFCDTDRDGWLDLVATGSNAATRVYLNHSGTLETTASWFTTDNPAQFALYGDYGDMDGDGWFELFVADNTQLFGGTGRLRRYNGLVGGLFTTTPVWSYYNDYGSAVTLADLDADGDLDLACGAWWGRTDLFFNTGGVLPSTPNWSSAPISVVEAIVFGDVNNDGLRNRTQTFPANGLRLLHLSHRPVQRVLSVAVDGRLLGPDEYCFDAAHGWISLGATPAVNTVVRYVFSLGLDMAITNWDDDLGNFLYYNQLTPVLPGDLDGDGDVDLSDFTVFQLCFGGSNNPPAPTCPPGIDADLDGDGDVDLADFLIFQQNFTGSL